MVESMVASLIASRTKRLRTGTAVQLIPLQHPIRLAGEITSLDHLSRGRFDFGIGRSGSPRSYDALGVPYEQAFVEEYTPRLLNVGVIKTSGGLFNFLSGSRARAPAWMQAIGLEWAWRIWLEPRRLFWRYLTTNPRGYIRC